MKLNELKKLLTESGVVGAGGAGFPSSAKLSDKADTIVVNCSECEPLLRVHRQVMEEYAHEIILAVKEVMLATGAQRAIIALKDHYKKALRAVESEIADKSNISICRLKAVYPAGDELILIKETTGRVVKPGNLPISVGVTVFNAETLYNIYRAINGSPVTHKFVTVAGEVGEPKTLRVPLGTRISELIKEAGGLCVDECEYISGGPMMGKIVSESDVVTKTTNAIIALPEKHNVILNKTRNAKINLRRTMSVCCQCRSCTEICSRHVLGYPVEPHMVMRVFSNGGRGDKAAILGSLYCSGCGLCEAYSCPQGLSPRTMIQEFKNAAKAAGVKPPLNIEPVKIKDADYKRVSVGRLTMRLGLKKYDRSAPMSPDMTAAEVKIPLVQHIGAKACPTVNVGDAVVCGSTVAKINEGALGADIHASIDGKITEITDKYIKIVN